MGGKPANAWPEERTKKLIHLLEKGKREGNISYHRIAESSASRAVLLPEESGA